MLVLGEMLGDAEMLVPGDAEMLADIETDGLALIL